MIETVIVDAIEAIDGLREKAFPLCVPEGTDPPYVVYISNGTTEDDSLTGWIGSFDTEMELHVIHSSYKGMKLLAKRVADALKAISDYAITIREDSPEEFDHSVNAYHKIIRIKIMH